MPDGDALRISTTRTTQPNAFAYPIEYIKPKR
jgi:hypothetical protein